MYAGRRAGESMAAPVGGRVDDLLAPERKRLYGQSWEDTPVSVGLMLDEWGFCVKAPDSAKSPRRQKPKIMTRNGGF